MLLLRNIVIKNSNLSFKWCKAVATTVSDYFANENQPVLVYVYESDYI